MLDAGMKQETVTLISMSPLSQYNVAFVEKGSHVIRQEHVTSEESVVVTQRKVVINMTHRQQ